MTSTAPEVRTSVTYSGSLATTPVFNRPLVSCAALSGVGTSVSYQVQPFFVDATGAYTIEVTASTLPDGDSMLFIYQGRFDPSDALSNCMAADDDGGVDSLSLITTSLTAGIEYFAVTTTFDNGIFGDFTAQVSGPGLITLGSPTLAITKTTPTGVPSAGPFAYRISVQNVAATTQYNVSISDTLPAALTYLSNDCGGSLVAGVFTVAIASIPAGASVVCDLTVFLTAGVCSMVSNTANAQVVGFSPVSAMVSNQFESVLDGGLEGATGIPLNSPFWTETSTNFSSPLCSEALCGNGAGTTGARTGNIWVWFGGIPSTEISGVQQTLTIPVNATALTFYYRLGTCAAGAGAADFVRVTLDGAELWRRDANAVDCGAAGYTQASVPLTAAQADNASHALRFESTSGSTGISSNFNIDDISIKNVVCAAPTLADLSIALTNDAASNIQLHQQFHYLTSVANTGPANASGVVVTLTLADGISYVSNTCGATLLGNLLSWVIPSLPNGGHANCTVTAAVSASGQIQTVANIAATSTGDPEPTNNTVVNEFAFLYVVPTLNHGSSALLFLLMSGFGIFVLRRNLT